MKNLTSSEIRKMFLDYFESKDHLIVPSASLIPDNDPSILWINAGVAPLKKYFDGSKIPVKRRLANSQKCIRTNDIENVGKTSRHHTFFEMLGNFSIGDYFRDEALSYAWELLTSPNWYDIDKSKLYVTVYPDDVETYNKWLSLGVDESHIIKCKSNFWDIGPGPCGPDSEIFYDRGSEYDPDNLGIKLLEDEIENDRYIEIWNNVFSQYNHIDGLDRKDFPILPHKNIDTGMGLERLTCIIQNGKSNYDTDLFMPIIRKIEEISNVKYEGQMAFKVIADHIKTLVFALSDGAYFSNEKRGYVLRRILRRASRFGRTLGIYEPFMYKLTDSVLRIMIDYYPYLKDNKQKVDKQIMDEEKTFLKTLSAGEKRLNELTNSGKVITAEDVFKLYDTYGFPYELTKEILDEKNISINKEEFDKCMQKQRQMARKSSSNSSSMSVQGDVVNFKEESLFVGYDNLETKARVIFVGNDEGNVCDIYSSGVVITDKTPFYATMGGQEGDIGYITSDNLKAEVYGCVKAPNGQNMHLIRLLNGSIKVGDYVTLTVDKENRFDTCQNHSATHLLQKSLQEVLGSDLSQAGSYVDNNTLRFDFKYNGKITDDDIILVESKVNDKIKACYPAEIKEMSLDEAKKMGAMALFDEKYGDRVRVVKFGDSIELCGGTHVTNSGNIRSFAIKSIESKGLNVYRIEAVCDTNLQIELFEIIKPYNDEMILLLSKAKRIINDALSKGINLDFNISISNERPSCYKDILENKKEVANLRKEVSILEKKYKEELINAEVKKIDEYVLNKIDGKYGDVLLLNFKDYDIDVIKSLVGFILPKLNNGIVFITTVKDNAINFVCKANDSLKDKFNAGVLIKDVAKIAQGNGGGSVFFGQGGGSRSDKLDIINDYVKSVIVEK